MSFQQDPKIGEMKSTNELLAKLIKVNSEMADSLKQLADAITRIANRSENFYKKQDLEKQHAKNQSFNCPKKPDIFMQHKEYCEIRLGFSCSC